MPLALCTALWLLIAGPPGPAPRIDVSHRDAFGCGAPALDGVPLEGSAPGLCVRDAFTLRLEAPALTNVVLRVVKDGRDRVFIYRLEGHRLVPRFLGSGPGSLSLVELRRGPGTPLDRLEIVALRESTEIRLSCRFEEFPLVCDELAR